MYSFVNGFAGTDFKKLTVFLGFSDIFCYQYYTWLQQVGFAFWRHMLPGLFVQVKIVIASVSYLFGIGCAG